MLASEMAHRLKAVIALAKTRFGSQYPHGRGQLSATPVPGDPTPSADLFRHQAHNQCTDMHTGKAFITLNKRINLKKPSVMVQEMLGRQNQTNPWGFLAGQPRLLGEPRPIRDLVSKNKEEGV